MEQLERNRAAVMRRIEGACRSAGRDVAEVGLVAVTKRVEPEIAAALVSLGLRDLGENRVDELERKAGHPALRETPPVWHFVGHVQRNKARRVVSLADEIHSVDSLRLIEALERLAAEEGRRPGVYLQVKLTREETKHGLAPEDLPAAARAAAGCEHLRLLGVMGMGPRRPDPAQGETSAAAFARLAALARELPSDTFADGRPLLSMGMSGDLEDAVAAGSHRLRIGSALLAGFEGTEVPLRPVTGPGEGA